MKKLLNKSFEQVVDEYLYRAGEISLKGNLY